MSENFYQINNNSMNNNLSYNAIAESHDPAYIIYPKKQDHIVSPINSKKSLDEAKSQYFKRKSSSLCKSMDSSQLNTRWTSKKFQDDFLSDDQSDDDNQEVRSRDSLFKMRLKDSKKQQIAQQTEQYRSKDNRSLGLCDQDLDEDNNQGYGDENENDVSSLEAEEGEQDEIVESLQKKLKEIPTCQAIPIFQELDRQIKSLRELPSEMIQKQNFLLGEKIPLYFDNMTMNDEIDEIDEIDEGEQNCKDNHRKKLSINPIFHCNEIRLRFRVDSYNTGDENIHQENDDIIVKNLDQLKKNHQQLKENKLMMNSLYHKSCINL